MSREITDGRWRLFSTDGSGIGVERSAMPAGRREPIDWADRGRDRFDRVETLLGSMPVSVACLCSHPLLDHPPM
jgi:hypothetical protein